MIFKKIKLKNIRSYRDQEIEFPKGSLLITGDIGSGKSSILLAIEYALFGLQPGQKGAALLRNLSETGEVSLEFEIEDKTVLIERKLKRTIKGVSNEYAAITINGEKTESSVTEIKSKVVELLGYPPEFIKRNNLLYRYTVHSPQEQLKQIILEDPESRINILRHIFGMDRYRQIKENLSVLLTHIKSDSKILQGEIKSLESDREILSQKKQNLQNLLTQLLQKEETLNLKSKNSQERSNELEQLRKEVEKKFTFESEIEKTKLLITTKKEKIVSFQKELSELERRLRIIKPFNESEQRNVIETIKSRKLELESLQDIYSDLSGKERALTKENTNLLEKRKRIFKIDICPTCLQDVPDNHKHNILNETDTNISSIKTQLKKIEFEKKDISIRINSLKENLKNLEQKNLELGIHKSQSLELTSLKEKQSLREKQLVQIQQDKQMLLSHLDGLKEKLLACSPLEIKFRKKTEESRQAVSEEKNAEIALAELNKEIEISEKEIELFKKILSEREKSKRDLQHLEELQDWLSSSFLNLVETIERNVLLKLRNEFSALFRKWFLLLIPENSLDSQIDDNFSPVIVQNESEMDYDFLSGGERTAAALAYRLALNQTINSILSKLKTKGLIVLDEPTDGFSEAQIEKFRDILEELETDQLILVSHEQKMEGFVDNVLRVKKEGDSSDIETLSLENHQKA